MDYSSGMMLLRITIFFNIQLTMMQYYFGLLAISFVVTAPYMTLPRWRNNFIPPQQHRNINSIWYASRLRAQSHVA